MKNLIYYPGFEVRDPAWLKFALLYIDELNPIIPESGDRHLSDLHLKMIGETDLLASHRPTDKEGWLATLDAMGEIEKVMKRPESYSPLFGSGDFLSAWKSPDKHDYTLFLEKYTDDWKRFCIHNHFGTPTSEGIKVHEDLAFVYMTLLAQTIADSRGLSPISDHPKLDEFSIFTRTEGSAESEKIEVAQAVIELQLPANLNEIDLSDVISVRNRQGFKTRLEAFHQEFDKYFDSIESGARPGKFVASFDSIWKDFADDILQTGLGTISFGLGVWITVNSVQAGPANYLKEVVAGTLLAVGGAVKIQKTWKNSQTKRYTRKYLTDLTKIKPVTIS